MARTGSAEKVVQDIRRKTRRRFSAEEKIRIVLEGLRGEESVVTFVSPRRAQSESVLPVEQGVSRGREAAAGRGHNPRGHLK